MRLVVLVLELARVEALAWRLDLDEADQRLECPGADADGKVQTGLQVAQRRFADQHDRSRRKAKPVRQAAEQLFERVAQLVLGLASGGRIGELGLGSLAELGDGLVDGHLTHTFPHSFSTNT